MISNIHKPEDLWGKLVGVPEYSQTAAVWARGILEEEFGVAPSEIRWMTGGVTKEQRKWDNRISYTPPPGVEINVLPPGASLDEYMRKGILDAAFIVRNLP